MQSLRKNKKKEKGEVMSYGRRHFMSHLWVVLVVLIVLIGIIFGVGLRYGNEQEYTCTIEDRWIKSVGDDDQKYLFNCEEHDIVFENTDLVFKFKFNSSDMWIELDEGETYTITTVGRRIPFFSMYQNVVEIELVEEE